MEKSPLHGVTVYVHKDDLFDALEKYANRDYVEVKILTPGLVGLYGDGPPHVRRQTGGTMYDIEPFPVWGK